MLRYSEIFERMNELGAEKTPFLFIIDFLKNSGKVIPLDELNDEVEFKIHAESEEFNSEIKLKKYPISFDQYEPQFNLVKENILLGNSYLTNLTCATPIEINLNLEEIYRYSKSKYKLFWKEHFVCFSPETFVKIHNGKIYSYPMKGTIDASVENAAEKILSDEKEMAEHYTIVDLIRNDLSQVAKKVTVEKFRYIDEISTHERKILQVSSEISGKLAENFHENIGTIFNKLLPAGSICGAPKKKTVEIILEAENYNRNFYTGVFGVFDGENLDSAVMIRFIEQTDKGLVFKSGGGITHQSNAEDEYNEMIQKVYVPIY
ncbi:aminodeoxychorismate synthase component I [Moheibacter sediminis]|uniref:Aminodeoxychorismate synthase, subunit I n=1 Tax=Moheibacter sediminis TaxID=1434700 RepID=A0A1W2BBT4_9FLAO|nr:aminodeoxychorismate synthase component I [Moheibacter sediminis]SMC70425.1 aminodeoxychorismate synthase, subunit I [Moheibacter sediminis]